MKFPRGLSLGTNSNSSYFFLGKVFIYLNCRAIKALKKSSSSNQMRNIIIKLRFKRTQ